MVMEAAAAEDLMPHDHQETEAEAEVEEEYVLIDLDAVSGQVDISPDTPYVLSVCLFFGPSYLHLFVCCLKILSFYFFEWLILVFSLIF